MRLYVLQKPKVSEILLGKQVLPVQARPPCQCLAVGFAERRRLMLMLGVRHLLVVLYLSVDVSPPRVCHLEEGVLRGYDVRISCYFRG